MMSRLFIDGFENGGIYIWDYAAGSNTVSASYKYTGDYGLYSNSGTLRKDLSSPVTTVYLAFKFRYVANANRAIISLKDSGGDRCFHIYQLNPPYLTGMIGNGGASYNNPSFTLNSGTWYFVEVYYYQHASAGAFTVKIDGIDRLSQTGINTGSNPVSSIEIGPMYSSNYPTNGYYDDLVVDDADWIGDTAIIGLSPNGAGNSAQWDPSAGSNYACVDEVPASDADYVSTNVNDEIDTYALANMGISPYSIKSVQVMARAQKEGASTPQNIALVVRTGSTDYQSSDQALATSFKGHTKLWEQNPNTAAAWTESDVNGLEAGVKARA